jgi:hypothetical protein
MTRHYGRGVVDQLMDDLRMYGNAFALVEWQGQDWPETKEEESRMKQIDFAKPLCTVDKTGGHKGGSVEVVKEGLTLVRFTGELHVVDENGKIEGYAIQPGDGTLWVENVPEEPKDYLHLYRREGEEWRIDFGIGQLYTKEQAENLSRGWARHAGAKSTVVVKVQV